MRHVLRFEDGKSFELYRCPNCHCESKAYSISFPQQIISPLDNKNNKDKKTKRKRKQKRKGS